MEKFKDYKFIWLRLNGLDWYIERLGGLYIACSTYAPDLVRCTAEVYHIDILSGFECFSELREWVAAA